jgi:malate dehydrogenase (oxaloacetate-decarboxylating)
MDIDQESLDLHRAHHGKIEVKSKVPLNDRHDLSLAYTPGVARVSIEIWKDRSLAREYTLKHNTVAIVSDGSAILGLGNLGAEAAIPVMEGKAALFKEFGGVDAFPICLATQDTEEIIRTVRLIAPVFGGINLEDISAPRCFEIERRLRAELDIPVLHDDQHGTAVVVLAGLINALGVRHRLPMSDTKIIMNGAGAAGLAVTDLLLQFGFSDVTVCDSKGIIGDDRTDLNKEKIAIAKRTNPRKLRGGLVEALSGADVFIGVSKGNLLTAEMVKTMASQPIIFALANPTPEIMPGVAKAGGAFIVATGRSDYPNQVNNVLAFPGIFRGALDHQVREITDAMLMDAARALAACVSDPTPEKILPDAFDKSVVKAVAGAIKS